MSFDDDEHQRATSVVTMEERRRGGTLGASVDLEEDLVELNMVTNTIKHKAHKRFPLQLSFDDGEQLSEAETRLRLHKV